MELIYDVSILLFGDRIEFASGPFILIVTVTLSLFAMLLLVSSTFAISSVEAYGFYTFYNKWGTFGEGEGQFAAPYDVIVDSSGDVFVADSNNHRIQKFDSIGTFNTAWGREDLHGAWGIGMDSLRRVYVADPNFDKIAMFIVAENGTGVLFKEWGTFGSGDGQFNSPTDVAVDHTTQEVYVADLVNSRVQKFTISDPCPEGTTQIVSGVCFVTKWGEFGSGNGQFNGPSGVAVDSSGHVYVADLRNHRIQKFTGTGIFIGAWGTFGSGDGQFYLPNRVSVDSSGHVYVADTENHRIQKFKIQKFNISLPCPEGTTQIIFGVCFITKWGTFGSGDGQFKNPRGISIDSSGDVYVADANNNRIQVFFWKDVPVVNPFPDIVVVYAVMAVIIILLILNIFRSRLKFLKSTNVSTY